MSKEAVYKAADRLMERHGLNGSFCMVVIKAGPVDVIVVATIRGREQQMPELPDTFDGFPIKRMAIGMPVARPALRGAPRPARREGDNDGPWSFSTP